MGGLLNTVVFHPHWIREFTQNDLRTIHMAAVAPLLLSHCPCPKWKPIPKTVNYFWPGPNRSKVVHYTGNRVPLGTNSTGWCTDCCCGRNMICHPRARTVESLCLSNYVWVKSDWTVLLSRDRTLIWRDWQEREGSGILSSFHPYILCIHTLTTVLCVTRRGLGHQLSCVSPVEDWGTSCPVCHP